jgi:biopolymer transport protein ExbD
MRRPIRRSDNAYRLEMTPMIDVIFLLLTFFVYSMVMMIRADVLPVKLAPVAAGRPAQAGRIEAITVDRLGRLFYNREPVTVAQLDARLATLAADANHPRLWIAMEAAGGTDRGPVLLALIGRVQRAGINDIGFVGPRDQPRPAPPPEP